MKKISLVFGLGAAFLVASCSDKPADQEEKQALQEDASAPTETSTMKEPQPMAEAYAQENLAYLEANQAKEGVIVTDSGLQYFVIESGDGASPTVEDFVTVHYKGQFIDGREFDSSYARGEPATFPAGRLIPGFTEALTLMKVGDKWEVTIPSDLAYGPNGAGGGVIPGDSTLVFQLELLDVMNEAQAEELAKEQQAASEAEAQAFRQSQMDFLTLNLAKDGIKATESGLQYRVIKEGEGATPGPRSKVTVHYSGKLTNGEEFDSSYKRGEPIQFPLNGVIKGWTEGVQLMKEGAKYEFFLPYDLAYGERGTPSGIPPYATLVFIVELISVDRP
jgi:peptidylprolyl isomerase